MGYTIALLLKEHYREHVEEWKQYIPSDIQTEYITYSTFKELEEQFLSVKERVDGIYVSGIMPWQALRILMGKNSHQALAYSPINLENTYKVLLQKMISARKQSLARVGMDFLNGYSDLEELIMSGKFSEAVHSYEERWEKMDTIAQIEEEENAINRYYRRQCLENKFDMVITYFYSVVETLRDLDVECVYVYPSAQAFEQIMDGLKSSISLREMRSKLPAVVYFDTDGDEELGNRLRKSVALFNRKHMNRLMKKESYSDLEYITDYGFLKELTNDFVSCPLKDWLKRDMDYEGAIGYGIGGSVYQARLNAIDAARYARRINGRRGASVLIDEKDSLRVLQKESTENMIHVSEKQISEIADNAKLSAETILRIMGVMQASGSSEITSQELIDALQISLRTANKFLSILEKHGYARVTGLKRNGNKGRPVNVYKIMFETEKRES